MSRTLSYNHISADVFKLSTYLSQIFYNDFARAFLVLIIEWYIRLSASENNKRWLYKNRVYVLTLLTFKQTGQEQFSLFRLWSLLSRMSPATTSDGTISRSPNTVYRALAASCMATPEDLLLLDTQQRRVCRRRNIFRWPSSTWNALRLRPTVLFVGKKQSAMINKATREVINAMKKH